MVRGKQEAQEQPSLKSSRKNISIDLSDRERAREAPLAPRVGLMKDFSKSQQVPNDIKDF